MLPALTQPFVEIIDAQFSHTIPAQKSQSHQYRAAHIAHSQNMYNFFVCIILSRQQLLCLGQISADAHHTTSGNLFLQPLRHILDLSRQHILLITIQTPQPFFRLSQIGFVAHQPGRLACACPPAEKNQPLRLAGLLLCDFPDTRQRFAGN